MKSNHRRFLLLVLILLAFATLGLPQKPSYFNRYKPRTLAQLIDLNREGTEQAFKGAKLDERHDFIGKEPFYSRVTLEYVGTPRPISAEHLRLMNLWAKLQRTDEKFLKAYANEYLFRESGTDHWIPIQKGGEPILAETYHSGDKLDVYLVYIGAGKDKGSSIISALVLSTGFEK